MYKIITHNGYKFKIEVTLNIRVNKTNKYWEHYVFCQSIELSESCFSSNLIFNFGTYCTDIELLNTLKLLEDKIVYWCEDNNAPNKNEKLIDKLIELGFNKD